MPSVGRYVVDSRSHKEGPTQAQALWKLATAVELHAYAIIESAKSMSNDFSGLNAALDAVAQGIVDVAAAIANPATDNSDQATIDGFTARLTDLATQLSAAKVAEDAEDAGTPAA